MSDILQDFKIALSNVVGEVNKELQTLSDKSKLDLDQLSRFADDVFEKVPELYDASVESLQKFYNDMVSISAMSQQAAARAKTELDAVLKQNPVGSLRTPGKGATG